MILETRLQIRRRHKHEPSKESHTNICTQTSNGITKERAVVVAASYPTVNVHPRSETPNATTITNTECVKLAIVNLTKKQLLVTNDASKTDACALKFNVERTQNDCSHRHQLHRNDNPSTNTIHIGHR